MDIFIPSLVSKKKGPFPSFEIDIDYLPARYTQNWSSLISIITKKWIAANGFKKTATIWLRGCQSVDFHHPQASWSEFIVPIGFPNEYFRFLQQKLQEHWMNAVCVAYLHKNEAWDVLYHAENGKLWEKIDAVTWIESPAMKDRKEKKTMVKSKSPEEIARILCEIYKKSFMRKRSGAYRITMELFKEIVGGRKNLKLSPLLAKVHDELRESAYAMIDLDDSIVILNKKAIAKQRKVPKSAVLEYIYFVDDE